MEKRLFDPMRLVVEQRKFRDLDNGCCYTIFVEKSGVARIGARHYVEYKGARRALTRMTKGHKLECVDIIHYDK